MKLFKFRTNNCRSVYVLAKDEQEALEKFTTKVEIQGENGVDFSTMEKLSDEVIS